MDKLIEFNGSLDLPALSKMFAEAGRLQVRNVLSERSASRLQKLLIDETPWGLACQAGGATPAQLVRSSQLRTLSGPDRASLAARAAADPEYGFAYYAYPLVTAYLEQWRPGSPHEQLLEELNSPASLDFMRSVTGVADIVKMDGQATLYAPGHFLRPHNDEESARGRLVAYVLNLTLGEWQPHWGGYLNFFDAEWNVEQAFGPRFNTLNLFRVPQWHAVSEVTASAPLARYAITGWARDR